MAFKRIFASWNRVRVGHVARAGLCVAALVLAPVHAAEAKARSKAGNPRHAAIVIDARSGETLYAKNADATRYPASLTKMMTLFILFEEIERGRVKLNSSIRISPYAASRPPTKLGLKAGSTITVDHAIKAVAVKSTNDIAVAIAEHIEGSEAAFASRMTRTARSLGMRGTTFRNANGLPNPEQKTTARDMALLGRALHDRFPRYYKYFSTREFSYGKRRYRNTNRLLGTVRGMDGIKTGYTRASGFNLVTSVQRDGRHIVAVVLGGTSSGNRNAEMASLIERHLPNAGRGRRTAPLLVASASAAPSVEAFVPTGRPVEDDALTAATRASLRMPTDVSGAEAPAQPEARPLEPITVASIVTAPKPIALPDDPIAARIMAASEVAALAYVAPGKRRGKATRLVQVAATATHPQESAAEAKGDLIAGPAQGAAPIAGWHIQIGALPDEDEARALLSKAQTKVGRALASYEPFTQPVDKDGATLYRARFAGFAGKTEARAACAALKRQSIACLAIQN